MLSLEEAPDGISYLFLYGHKIYYVTSPTEFYCGRGSLETGLFMVIELIGVFQFVDCRLRQNKLNKLLVDFE